MSRLLSLFVIGTLIAGINCDCTATLSASRTEDQSWEDQNKTNAVYQIAVFNAGSEIISEIELSFMFTNGGQIKQSWNLNAASSAYGLANFGGSIAPGASFTGAGFIASYTSSPMTVTVQQVSIRCMAATTAPAMPASPAPGSESPIASPELLAKLKTAGTEVDRQALLTDSQFVFDFTSATVGVTKAEGGKTVAALPSNFPAIVGHGIAMTVGFIEPCGINLPHTHPRATEINYIVSGEFQAGLFQENGARFITNILKPGMATVFPMGAIHFEINLSCEKAVFVAGFNNEDPGVQTTSLSFFGLPSNLVSSFTNASISTVEDLARFLPHNPASMLGECKARCGITA